jgi:hypothetical protein
MNGPILILKDLDAELDYAGNQNQTLRDQPTGLYDIFRLGSAQAATNVYRKYQNGIIKKSLYLFLGKKIGYSGHKFNKQFFISGLSLLVTTKAIIRNVQMDHHFAAHT